MSMFQKNITNSFFESWLDRLLKWKRKCLFSAALLHEPQGSLISKDPHLIISKSSGKKKPQLISVALF